MFTIELPDGQLDKEFTVYAVIACNAVYLNFGKSGNEYLTALAPDANCISTNSNLDALKPILFILLRPDISPAFIKNYQLSNTCDILRKVTSKIKNNAAISLNCS